MALRPCLGCGTLTPHSRCTACSNTRMQPRCPRPDYTWAERQRRKHTVDQHVTIHGYLCPGWDRPAHPARDLTADHITPVASGAPESGPLQVLCRRCNAAKGDTIPTPPTRGIDTATAT
jgi:5-methylcytosine-specific restriction protein A